jgi:hypothetical protein
MTTSFISFFGTLSNISEYQTYCQYEGQIGRKLAIENVVLCLIGDFLSLFMDSE